MNVTTYACEHASHRCVRRVLLEHTQGRVHGQPAVQQIRQLAQYQRLLGSPDPSAKKASPKVPPPTCMRVVGGVRDLDWEEAAARQRTRDCGDGLGFEDPALQFARTHSSHVRKLLHCGSFTRAL
jgi:hypothetical protein